MVTYEAFNFMKTLVMCPCSRVTTSSHNFLYGMCCSSCGSVWVRRQEVVNREAADNGAFLSVVYLILCDLG